MSSTSDGIAGFTVHPLPDSGFGAQLRFPSDVDAQSVTALLETETQALLEAFYTAGGLLLIPGMQAISEEPQLLLRLSRLFGPEVENYRQTLTPPHMVHDSVAEILLVSNIPPVNRQPPPQPEPPLTADGRLPVQFPQRRGWHSDQSFRRPPPDISLFFAVIPAPSGQGQTLYADGTGAYQALPESCKQRIDGLQGIHVLPGTGRSEYAVKAGEPPQDLLPHQQPQRQPLVRMHPVTGKRALYLCEAGQMDWISGPFAGMQPGPYGDGAELLYRIMTHLTQPQFVYTHDWNAGDLIIYDNRSLLHAATWYDADRHQRMMWRTTVMGNPGDEYAGAAKSWLPQPDTVS
jgi:taurine dioxygenase